MPAPADAAPEEGSEPVFRSDMGVELVKASASDGDVVWAARVSTAGEKSLESLDEDPERSAGLIRYLLRNRHGSPFEHTSFTFLVSAPIFVFREFMRHRVGFCLAGDTEVWCESYAPRSGRTLRKRPIAELWRNWHEGVPDSLGRTRLLPACRRITVRTLDESTGQFTLSRVVDIVRNGVKPVLRLRTAHGETLVASADHQIWSPTGWVKLGELVPGDLVARNGKVSRRRPGTQVPPALRRGIGVWTSMQRDVLIRPVDSCRHCLTTHRREDLVLDHRVPVVSDLSRALDVTNLEPVCQPCHRVKSNTEQILAQRDITAGVVWAPVTSVEPAGEEMTYDLELEGPVNRGFVANGIVVHNSYNEESGRYRELAPVFYVPGPERRLVQQGKPGRYEFVPGSPEQHALVEAATRRACETAHAAYREMLDAGVAREVARGVLPVATYSSMYVTCNARSMMSFLSLRTESPGSTFPSYPQREIAMVAEAMEAHFARLMPITHEAFLAAGRVSP